MSKRVTLSDQELQVLIDLLRKDVNFRGSFDGPVIALGVKASRNLIAKLT